MPDGTVPSSTEAVRAALSAARASLERQLVLDRSDAAEDAMRQVQSAIELLPRQRFDVIADVEWVDAFDAATVERTYMAESIPRDVPAVEPGDDLTRIRGIDATLAARLAALGIRRYEQIASWETDDVRVIADAMGLGRRFLAMGIVDQAGELVRRKRVSRDNPQPLKPASDGSREVSYDVAIWKPTTPVGAAATTNRSPGAWHPLEGDDLHRAVRAVRQRLPANYIVTLAQLVPALAQPIYVAADGDATIELPRWRTGVLVPFVEPATPDLTQYSPHARPIMAPEEKPKPARTIVISAPTLEGFAPVQAPPRSIAEPPLHVRATERLAGLEAALETFPTTRAAVRQLEDVPPLVPAARIAVPPQDSPSPTHGSRNDVEEADVKIVTGGARLSSRSNLLAPLPDLPFRKRSAAVVPPGGESRSVHHVQEAAVVIVRRSGAPLANQRPAVVKGGAVRRFLKSLAGR